MASLILDLGARARGASIHRWATRLEVRRARAQGARPCPPTSLSEKRIEPGAKAASHGLDVIFETAERVVPQELFGESLRLIDALRPRPVTAQELGRSDASSRRGQGVSTARRRGESATWECLAERRTPEARRTPLGFRISRQNTVVHANSCLSEECRVQSPGSLASRKFGKSILFTPNWEPSGKYRCGGGGACVPASLPRGRSRRR